MLWRAASLLAVLPFAASANLMTFDEGLTYNQPSQLPTFTEDGITASGGIAYYGTPGSAHIDHFGTPFSSSLDFFMTSGEMFIADSVMISTSGTEYCAFPCEDGLFDDTYDYLSISGFVDDALVASVTLFLPSSGSSFELLPLSLLGAIDRLRVGVIAPDDPGRHWGCGLDHGCSHVDIDNIHLTPVSVPEPGTLLLFGGALAGAGLMRRRGRA